MTNTQKYYKKIPINKTKRNYVINNKKGYLVNTQRNIKKKHPPKNKKKKWTLKKTLNLVKEIRENVDDPLQQKKMFGGANIHGELHIEDNLLSHITNQLDLIETFLVTDDYKHKAAPLFEVINDEIIQKLNLDLNIIKTLIRKNTKLNRNEEINQILTTITDINIENIKDVKSFYTKLKGYIIFINNTNDTTFTLKSSTIDDGENKEEDVSVQEISSKEVTTLGPETPEVAITSEAEGEATTGTTSTTIQAQAAAAGEEITTTTEARKEQTQPASGIVNANITLNEVKPQQHQQQYNHNQQQMV